MGARGPAAAPENIRALRGMKPLKDPQGRRVKRLVLAPKAPSMPKLSPGAAAEWRRVTRELARAGVLAEVDRGVLVAYCTAWAHMMEAEMILRAEGITRLNGDKIQVRHPAFSIYREANRTLLAAAVQIYASPVARLRIPLAPGTRDDDGADDDLFD